MPSMKQAIRWAQGVPENLSNIAERLRKVRFDANNDLNVVATDYSRGVLAVEIVRRKPTNIATYDADVNRMVIREDWKYPTAHYTFNAVSGNWYCASSGGQRTFEWLQEVLKLAHVDIELQELGIGLITWAKALLKMYEDAQLTNINLGSYYSEPKLIGKYDAKSVDNRLEIAQLETLGGQLKSLKYAFFYMGTKRTVEVRSDGVITVSTGEEDDLPHFHEEQVQVMLKHASRPQVTLDAAVQGDKHEA